VSRQTRRLVPRLEAFDERCLPSVTAGYVPGTTYLQITSDAASDNITINDSGNTGGVTVLVNGVLVGTFNDPVSAILVDGGDGNDVVTYNLTATLVSSRNIDVHLGKGNDAFTANLSNQGLAQYVSLDISTYGEGGGDTLTLNAQNFSSDQNSILNFDYVGGAGKDKINFNYTPGGLDLGSIILQKDQKH
jgi:hypothetical protein